MTRVLVVDDLPDVRFSFMFMLQALGYTPLEAQDGSSALAVISKEPVDVVLTDLYMPGMDGFALARAVHELPAPGRPAVICMTGVDIPSTDSVHMSVVLKKPVNRDTLLAAIRSALDGRQRTWREDFEPTGEQPS
jgi:two-component system, NarL family, sensor histidine kinase EvgS